MIELQTSVKTSKQDDTTRTPKPGYLKLKDTKAMLHSAIFLATCNAILLLRDVKLPNTSLH